MNRTMIWKAEEKELSEKLYKKLLGLTLLSPPTEEFRKCLSDDMFLKPNSQAFFHVMHFLFRLLDPAEFKRRFYWPLTDKKSEGNFRTATVEYLKYLNEKHQLQWVNVKSYLVVMPGGMKFIIFLLEFVAFVVRELTRIREKQLSGAIDLQEVSDLNLKRMRKQNEFFKEYTAELIKVTNAENQKVRDNIKLLKQLLEETANAIGVTVEELTSENFHAQFEASNRELFRKLFSQPTMEISSLESPLNELHNTIEQFQSKESDIKIDKDAVRSALQKISDLYPEQQKLQSINFRNNTDALKMSALVNAFNCINPVVLDALETGNNKPKCSESVLNEMANLTDELQELETQMSAFQKELNGNLKKCKNERKQYRTPVRCDDLSTTNRLTQKFIFTPPIRMGMEDVSQRNLRLALLDDFNTKLNESISNTIRKTIGPHSTRKSKVNLTDTGNTTLNKSKIIDPIQLLRTINKEVPRNKSSLNLSGLAQKWKQNQLLFDSEHKDDSTHTVTVAEQLEVTIFAQTSMLEQTANGTPFNANECTRITRTQYINNASNCSLQLPNKKSVVKKVRESTLNFCNISTSPSGRLDALGTVDEQGTPKIHVNDVTMNQTTETTQIDTKSPVEDIENDFNLSNMQTPKFTMDLHTLDDADALFNTSDTVLKNISM